MKTLSYPIRAEIADLYNTIMQGLDCLLLTDAILCGLYPYSVIEVISMPIYLDEICSSCEKRVDYSSLFLDALYKTKKPMKIVEATASSSVKTSFNLQSRVILCLSDLGISGKIVSKYK